MLSLALTTLCETSAWLRLRALLMMSVAIALLGLSACGGGGGGGGQVPAPGTGCTASTCGTAMIGITDADGDFLSYSVDVVSLTLTKADGAIVETLPVRQRVDFADLVDSPT